MLNYDVTNDKKTTKTQQKHYDILQQNNIHTITTKSKENYIR